MKLKYAIQLNLLEGRDNGGKGGRFKDYGEGTRRNEKRTEPSGVCEILGDHNTKSWGFCEREIRKFRDTITEEEFLKMLKGKGAEIIP